ncbi:MAG: hypothetical protein AAB281_00460 [Actinomycetota bacterium]
MLFALTLPAAGCTGPSSDPNPQAAAREAALADFQRYEQSHFGFFRAGGSYPYVKELNVHWQRPHPGAIVWGAIEKTEGDYDWSEVDRSASEAQDYGILILATIWPYADWDQEKCHEKMPPSPREHFPTLGDYRGKPCDTGAYERFLKALVERYDGDGKGDMPGLVYPIKYWEVINEPELTAGRPFFKSDSPSTEYLEVLRTTSETIKEADPDARVTNGGIASLNPNLRPFWEAVLGGEGSGLIDVLTVHSFLKEADLNLIPLNDFMTEFGIDKPVWVTEIMFAINRSFRMAPMPGPDTSDPAFLEPGGATSTLRDLTQDEWAAVMVKSFVAAYGRGADKLFYMALDNATPAELSSLLVYCSEKKGEEKDEDHFYLAGCQRQKSFFAYKTLVEKIDYFDAVDVLAETANVLAEGRYRFSIGDRTTYVLWGSGPLPAEIKGRIKLTDIYGSQSEVDAAGVALSGTPVYVEIVEEKG